jgi:hypothetical protein
LAAGPRVKPCIDKARTTRRPGNGRDAILRIARGF